MAEAAAAPARERPARGTPRSGLRQPRLRARGPRAASLVAQPASVPLPDYGFARAVTGQFEGGARLWEGEFAFPAASGQRGAPRR